MDTLKIYVACLASYNNGILYGKWINALQDKDEIYHDIFDMLQKVRLKVLRNGRYTTIQDLVMHGSMSMNAFQL